MSFEPFYMLRDSSHRAEALQDLDGVVLTVEAKSLDGDTIPAGSEGTIVGIWREGAAYEVEFAEPEGALCKVRPEQLQLIRRPEL
ncbi:DUF4926 domain-containing protein [Methylobacterium sp. J-059]|uniref:DUF4926 domain-containing protein n=1 Tax=Methylobacterium sp. J-059 TaxID=2836643 RepID=UPI001FBB0C18|nr:DUF4926 domain-containing protein [Methylobacterium sp. J-059]MCJ2042923.1 DUF4926 domain-containing protein [Methylobacterium sp. J-059]